MNPASNPTPKPGRPRALDDAKRREVCALISAGCGIAGAAKDVGCAASTIRREAQRNPEFDQQLRRANLTNELGPLNALRQASNKYWRAAAWLLERTNPQRFAKQSVKTLKPEYFQDLCDLMVDVVKQEARDPDIIERVATRLAKISKEADREATAIQSDPLYRPRRTDKHARRSSTVASPNDFEPSDDLRNA